MSESMQGADARDPSPATMRSYMVAEIHCTSCCTEDTRCCAEA